MIKLTVPVMLGHVSEWKGHRTQDQNVWDLFLCVHHVCRCRADFTLNTAVGHLAIMHLLHTSKLDMLHVYLTEGQVNEHYATITPRYE